MVGNKASIHLRHVSNFIIFSSIRVSVEITEDIQIAIYIPGTMIPSALFQARFQLGIAYIRNIIRIQIGLFCIVKRLICVDYHIVSITEYKKLIPVNVELTDLRIFSRFYRSGNFHLFVPGINDRYFHGVVLQSVEIGSVCLDNICFSDSFCPHIRIGVSFSRHRPVGFHTGCTVRTARFLDRTIPCGTVTETSIIPSIFFS